MAVNIYKRGSSIIEIDDSNNQEPYFLNFKDIVIRPSGDFMKISQKNVSFNGVNEISVDYNDVANLTAASGEELCEVVSALFVSNGNLNGFIDYNDTTGAISLTADTWTDIPNNGLGAFTNKSYMPTGVTDLIDVSTGYIDTTDLSLGDTILIRNDYTINPNTNNALLRFRYSLGNGGGTYTLEKIVGRLDSGSGQDYRFSLEPDLIYMGDDNTRLNPIKLQINCSSNATLTNAGSAISVIKR